MFSEKEYATYLDAFQRRVPAHWARFDCPTQRDFLLKKLWEAQLLPSETTIQYFIEKLAKQGQLVRVDGGNAENDFQRQVAKIQEEPLLKDEIDWFASLSAAELQDRYWQNNAHNRFAARYQLAMKLWGFIAPAKPKAEVTGE